MSSLGTPLKIDSSYSSRDDIRVKAEFDAAVPMKRSLSLIGVGGKTVEVKVEYEFYHLQCINCRVFGHDVLHCPKVKGT